jgi:xanthine dehydrogenase accessory factor
MNEVRALIEAFDGANERGERCALATVVSVEGSSYRRPGARMLVCEGGASTGTISAGCLEGDVVEHAKRVIRAGKAVLVEYDTASTSDEMAWGLGLGCNGIVRVLVEPLAHGSLYVEALRHSCEAQADSAPVSIATVYQHTPSGTTADAKASRIEIGGRLFVGADGEVRRENLSDETASLFEGDVRAGAAGHRVYEVAGGTLKVFVETLSPPVSLVVFGAGHDALPIVELARGLGWQTEVVDLAPRRGKRAGQDYAAHPDAADVAQLLARSRTAQVPVRVTRALYRGHGSSQTHRADVERVGGERGRVHSRGSGQGTPSLPGRTRHRGERPRGDRPLNRRGNARRIGRAARR